MWGAIGSIASSLIGGGLSYLGGREANSTSQRLAQAQMDFQRMMSNTAHQREVEDLKKAGLNPILSAKYGGASSPGGAMPNVRNELAELGEAVKGGVSSAVGVRKAEAEVANLQEQNKLLQVQQANTAADTGVKQALQGKTLAETYKAGAETDLSGEKFRATRKNVEVLGQTLRNMGVQEGILHSQSTSAKASAARDRVTEQMLDDSPWLRKMEIILELIGLGGRSFNSARSTTSRRR